MTMTRAAGAQMMLPPPLLCCATVILLSSAWLPFLFASAFFAPCTTTRNSRSSWLVSGRISRGGSSTATGPSASAYCAVDRVDDVGEGRPVRRPRVVVLGGGFGGINVARTLPTLPWSDGGISPEITLIDRSERFVFLPLLYELCVDDASLGEVAPTYDSLLDGSEGVLASLSSGLPDLSRALSMFPGGKGGGGGPSVSFVQAQVEGVDVHNKQVVLSKSDHDAIETIDYDALIVATGAEISLDAVSGASGRALPFYTVEQALELKRRLSLLDAYLEEDAIEGEIKEGVKVNIVIVGGGYSGVELALNIVDRFGSSADGDVQVSLIHRGRQILEYATEHNRNAGLERLISAGVKVMTSTSVAEVLPSDDAVANGAVSALKHQCTLKLSRTKSEDGATDGDYTLLPATLLLWTAGATPTSDRNVGVRNSALPRDVMGRILTSPTLNVQGHPEVFAIGDCSRPRKVPYPGTAQVAMQMATVAAWNAFVSLTYGNGSDGAASKLLRFKFLNLGEMMTLGTNDATITSLGGLVELSGPAASWVRRLIYAVRMPTPKQGVAAAVDGTGRKLARGAARGNRRKSKPVDWM